MYITCQQCSTIFRLDESLLKSTGSKVRCSQCKNVFVEYPPSPEADAYVPAAGVAAIEAEAEVPSEATYDQELEGIDLDELDAIFEQSDASSQDMADDSEAALAMPEEDSAAELDDEDLEMDFDLDSELENEPVIPTDQGNEPVVEASDDTLDDMDLDLDFELDAEGPDQALPVAELLESGDEATDDLDLDLEDIDFSLDDGMDDLDDGDADIEAVDAEPEADEELNLLDDIDVDALDADLVEEKDEDLSLDLDLSDEPSSEKLEEEDGDFALDLDLPDEPASEASEDLLSAADDVVPATTEDKGDEFSLDELDDMLGGNDTSGRVSAGVTRDTVDEDAELALDDASDDDTASEAMTALDADDTDTSSEGLDLSDLDAMLDEVDGLTEEETASQEAVAPSSEISDDLEDLDFELDAEFEDKPIADAGIEGAAKETEPDLAQDDEIDLSDIEQMLDGDADEMDTQQLEADFLGLDDDSGEKWSEGEAPELDLDDTDEINLDEIEAAIDQEDDGFVDDTIRMGDTIDEELSLDEDEELSLSDSSSEEDSTELDLEEDLVLELESDEPEPEAGGILEEDDELDLSDLDLGEDLSSQEENEVIDAGDIELEFQIEEDEPAVATAETAALVDSDQGTVHDFSIEDTVPAPEAGGTDLGADPVEPPKVKKSSSKGLVVLLITLLFAGVGYLYYAVAFQGLEIPYVSQLLKPQPKDPAGIFKLFTTDINSKFVDTEQSGRLFVIEGKVRNGYSAGRQMVRLQGKLFTTGKVLAKSEFAYAGVSISDEALASQPVAELKKKLNSGIAQGAATKVEPGASLPFMIVFSELPDKLDEFAIEAISSMPSK